VPPLSPALSHCHHCGTPYEAGPHPEDDLQSSRPLRPARVQCTVDGRGVAPLTGRSGRRFRLEVQVLEKRVTRRYRRYSRCQISAYGRPINRRGSHPPIRFQSERADGTLRRENSDVVRRSLGGSPLHLRFAPSLPPQIKLRYLPVPSALISSPSSVCLSLIGLYSWLHRPGWTPPPSPPRTVAEDRRRPPLLPAVLCAAAYLPGPPRPWFVLRRRLPAAAASTLPLLASPPRDGWSVGAAAALIASIVMARGRLAGSITPCGPP